MSSHVHNVKHNYGRVYGEYNLGVKQMAKWRETRKAREAARHEQERLEVLEWAKETAARRIKEKGIDKSKFYKNLMEDRDRRKVEREKERRYRERKRAAKNAAGGEQ